MIKKITIEEFKKLLIYSHCKEFRDAYQRDFYRDMMFNGIPDFVEVDTDILNLARQKLEEIEHENRLLSETARLNSLGIEYEKEGDIDRAIHAYEENINLGYPATHAFERLRILYRRLGDNNNMKRVLKRYAEVFGYDNEWVEAQYNRYKKRGRPT